jgi:protease I
MAKIACLVGEEFEYSELRDPMIAFEEAGHHVEIIGAREGATLTGKKGKQKIEVDESIVNVDPRDYEALFIPGGYSPDHLRADPRFLRFVREFDTLERPVLFICHGAQLLLSAGVVDSSRTLTAWKTVQGDLKYTGAVVKDDPVVVSGNWVSSRQPSDIPEFCQAALQMLERPGSGLTASQAEATHLAP